MKNRGDFTRKIEGAHTCIDSDVYRYLDLADQYAHFPPIQSIVDAVDRILVKPDVQLFHEDAMFLNTLLKQLKGGLDLLRLSLQQQEHFGFVDKQWFTERDALERALRRGRRAIELDVRCDKGGEFWVAHAPKIGGTVFGTPLHEMCTRQVERTGAVYSLEQALQLLDSFSALDHRFVIEIKTLGSDRNQYSGRIAYLKELLQKTHTTERVAIASLSPDILLNVHAQMPSLPLIMNGGIMPGISYTSGGDMFANMILPPDRSWHAVGFEGLGELIVTRGDEIVQRPDGHGTHTMYALTRMPNELMELLQKQYTDPDRYGKFGGVISLSSIAMCAAAFETVGLPHVASNMRRYYANIVKQMGIGTMVSTFGGKLGRVFSSLNRKQQIAVFQREMGPQVIYTQNPEEFAHLMKEPDRS